MDAKGATQELINEFKSQYDKLSIFARFGEDAFLSVYKSLRDAPDPVDTLVDTIKLADNLREDINRSVCICRMYLVHKYSNISVYLYLY